MRLDVEGLSLSQLPLLATPPAKQTPRRFHQISRVTLGTRRAIFCRRLLFFFLMEARFTFLLQILGGDFLAWQNKKPKSKHLGKNNRVEGIVSVLE